MNSFELVKECIQKMSTVQKRILVDALTSDNKENFDLGENHLYEYDRAKKMVQKAIENKENIILYGPASTGKSFLINQFREKLDEKGYRVNPSWRAFTSSVSKRSNGLYNSPWIVQVNPIHLEWFETMNSDMDFTTISIGSYQWN